MRSVSNIPLSVLTALLAGCYAVPPEIPADYGDRPLPTGWPAPAVYSTDVLHPANRWFQRLYSPVGRGGTFARASSDRPYAPRRERTAVDRAEIVALLEVVPAPTLPSPLSRLLLHSDLLAEARRLEATGDEALSGTYAVALRAVPAPRLEKRPAFVPPPLRQGAWLPVQGSLAAGLTATPADLREGRVFYQFAGGRLPAGRGRRAAVDLELPRRAALVRFRMALGDGGLRATVLASEGWFLESRAGEIVPRLFRFDRALAHLAEPWREVGPDEAISIRDPVGGDGPPLRGTLRDVCLSCHRPEAPWRTRREGFFVELGPAR